MKLESALSILAKELAEVTETSARCSLLRRRMPRFYSHVRRICDERVVLRRWGRCSNTDENTGTAIVDAGILDMIGKIANVPMKAPSYHAGLQHTYGYLLSLIETPYGYKRDRWLSPAIEDGFGLPSGSLSAFPRRGTLLVNLTSLLSRISLGSTVVTEGARASFEQVPFGKQEGWRITESVADLKIHTDIFPFLYGEQDQSLLVYSTAMSKNSAKLVTAFPIMAESRDLLLDSSQFGKKQTIRLRFNAYVENFTGGERVGSRTLQSLKVR